MSFDDTLTAAGRDGHTQLEELRAAEAFEDKYRLERILASGGSGVVLQATHRHLNRAVAVKLLHGGANDTTRQRFLREARLAAELTSPHVIRVLDYGFSGDGTPYLVMELLEGRTLKRRLEASRLEVDEALRLSRELLEALVDIHRSGIVHRDLKPSNVFLCTSSDGHERVKIIDFGIAKRLEDDLKSAADPALTGGGEVVGTVRYMAPEQIRHSSNVDARADLWSAGLVMHEMFTGQHPIAGKSAADVIAAVLGDTPIPVAEAPGLQSGVRSVLARCLQRDRDERFATAREVLDALPVPAHRPVLAAPELTPQPARRWWPWLAVGALIVGASLLYSSLRTEQTPALASGLALPTVELPASAAVSAAAPPAASAPPSVSAEPARPARQRPPARRSGPRWGDRH